jgi:hypothetical protein
MVSNWMAERDVLKEQLSDLQTRNDNLQTSLVNRDMTIEKLVRILTWIKKHVNVCCCSLASYV